MFCFFVHNLLRPAFISARVFIPFDDHSPLSSHVHHTLFRHSLDHSHQHRFRTVRFLHRHPHLCPGRSPSLPRSSLSNLVPSANQLKSLGPIPEIPLMTSSLSLPRMCAAKPCESFSAPSPIHHSSTTARTLATRLPPIRSGPSTSLPVLRPSSLFRIQLETKPGAELYVFSQTGLFLSNYSHGGQ